MPSEIKEKKVKSAVEPSTRVLRSRKTVPEVESSGKDQSSKKVPEKEKKSRKRQKKEESEPKAKKAKGAKVPKDDTEPISSKGQLVNGTDHMNNKSKKDTKPSNKATTRNPGANSKKTNTMETEEASSEAEEELSTEESNGNAEVKKDINKKNTAEDVVEEATNEAANNVETDEKDNEKATSIYDFKATTIQGEEVSLDKYKGHVCIIVNVASKCGHTASNYKELVELDDKYGAEKGLKILAFPCNQFGSQEPGDNQKICEFAEKRKVKFDMFEKVNVNGKDAHPLWKYLTSQKSGPKGAKIDWNFTKFLINKEGQVVERFKSAIKPLALVEELEKLW